MTDCGSVDAGSIPVFRPNKKMTEIALPKGTRDFLPDEKILRDSVVAALKETFEIYGYNPLETPALELYETLSSKYAGGSEILKEVYTLNDNANRKLGLRYDLTVPFARVIAMNKTIKKPFKRYQIDRVWRDGPIKFGRYREFWQCDVDVVGIKTVMAEAELLALTSTFFKKIGLEIKIEVNNRKLMNALLVFAGIPQEKQEAAILAIDKLKKIGEDGVRKEMEEKNISEEEIAKVLALFRMGDSGDDVLLERLEEILTEKEGIQELRELLKYIRAFGADNVKLEISLARGLAYYTGTVLEVYLADESISSSLAAGGRYDKMIGNFIGAKQDIPAVGMSFGLDVIADALKLRGASAPRKSVVELYIIPINTVSSCISFLQQLRGADIKCDMDFNNRGITKNLEYARAYLIPYVLIVGENELEKKQVKLRDMNSGKEKLLSLKEVIAEVRP